MNLSRFFLFFLILAFGGAGFLFGKKEKESTNFQSKEERHFPVVENKTFALVVYACNQSHWCEKALHSIFEQDYDYFRVIFIDDASNDSTLAKAEEYIIENNQEHRVVLIRNETRQGPFASFCRAAQGCLDKEIVVLLDAKDWFVHPSILSRLNETYQDPEVWLALASALQYPSYAKIDPSSSTEGLLYTFYSSLIKQIQPDRPCQPQLIDLAKSHIRHIQEPALFSNLSSNLKKRD